MTGSESSLLTALRRTGSVMELPMGGGLLCSCPCCRPSDPPSLRVVESLFGRGLKLRCHRCGTDVIGLIAAVRAAARQQDRLEASWGSSRG